MPAAEATVRAGDLRRDPEQELLRAAELGGLVWVQSGRQRFLLVSTPDGARETLLERAAALLKPRSQAIPLGGKAVVPSAGRVSPAELRRELSKGMGADRAERTAAELAALPVEAGSLPLMPWLRPHVARAVVRGAFGSDLPEGELAQLAKVVRWAGRSPRVARSGPTLHGLARPSMLARLSVVVRALLANADTSSPSELTAVFDLPPREREALAGELLLGAVGPLVQESGWTLFRLGTEPPPADAEAFVREVTRLHPTNPLIVRVAAEDTSVGDEPVSAGTLVVVNVAALHRDSAVFPEPERFLPERWLDGRTAEHRFSYAAFGIGDRRCLGEAIATRSLVALVESIGREWELSFGELGIAARGRRQLSDDVQVTFARR